MHNNTMTKTFSSRRINKIVSSIVKNIGNIIFIAFISIVIVMFVYTLWSKKTGNTSKPPIISAYVIISPSMVPTINVLDAVVSYRPNTDHLKKGDIITFSSSDARYTGLTVTHRILKVEEDEGVNSFRTKGDNNTTPDDAYVKPKNVFGKVIFIIPWLGYLQQFLSKPYGWIILVVIPCVGLIGYDVIKLKKSIEKSKTRRKRTFKDVEIKNKK